MSTLLPWTQGHMCHLMAFSVPFSSNHCNDTLLGVQIGNIYVFVCEEKGLSSWIIRSSTFKTPLLSIHDVSVSQNTLSMPIPQNLVPYTSWVSLLLRLHREGGKTPWPWLQGHRLTCMQNHGELKSTPSPTSSSQHLTYWTDCVVYLPL